MHKHLRLIVSQPVSGRPAKQIQLEVRRQAQLQLKQTQPLPPRAA